MELSPKKLKPPNPNGNPNFKPKWSTATIPIRVPENLADTLVSLARQVDSGNLKQSDLNKLCLNNDEIELELAAVTGKPALAIVPDQIPQPELLQKLEQFEAEQSASWGQSPNQRGEFKTSSRSWDKYREFKVWVQNHDR